jgi:hypothetical protein
VCAFRGGFHSNCKFCGVLGCATPEHTTCVDAADSAELYAPFQVDPQGIDLNPPSTLHSASLLGKEKAVNLKLLFQGIRVKQLTNFIELNLNLRNVAMICNHLFQYPGKRVMPFSKFL